MRVTRPTQRLQVTTFTTMRPPVTPQVKVIYFNYLKLILISVGINLGANGILIKVVCLMRFVFGRNLINYM